MIFERGRSSDEIYAIKSNNFDSGNMRGRSRDFIFKRLRHGMVISSKTPIELGLF